MVLARFSKGDAWMTNCVQHMHSETKLSCCLDREYDMRTGGWFMRPLKEGSIEALADVMPVGLEGVGFGGSCAR